MSFLLADKVVAADEGVEGDGGGVEGKGNGGVEEGRSV